VAVKGIQNAVLAPEELAELAVPEELPLELLELELLELPLDEELDEVLLLAPDEELLELLEVDAGVAKLLVEPLLQPTSNVQSSPAVIRLMDVRMDSVSLIEVVQTITEREQRLPQAAGVRRPCKAERTAEVVTQRAACVTN
jgi:hypothetical protein